MEDSFPGQSPLLPCLRDGPRFIMEALKVSKANLVFYLHPSKTNAVLASIRRELSSQLFRFVETFEGVLLAFEVVDVPNEKGKILSGLHPYVAVRLKANLLLFAPKPDTYLEGKVVKLAKESIHIIVLGFSAAIITEDDIRDELKYIVKRGEKVLQSTSHKRHIIKVGKMVRFIVKSFDEETLHISGSLILPNTGSIRWLNKNLQEAPLANSSRKRGDIEGRKDELDTGAVDNSAISDHYHVLKKPKKQRMQ